MELLNSSGSTGGVSVLTDDDAALRDERFGGGAFLVDINQELVYMTSMVTFGTMERTPRKKAV